MRRRRKPKTYAPTSPDSFTPPSYRGAILMLVVSLVVVILIWLAYGWALGEWTPPG